MAYRVRALAPRHKRTRRHACRPAERFRRVGQRPLALGVQIQLGAAARCEQHRRAAGLLRDTRQHGLHLSAHERELFTLLEGR